MAVPIAVITYGHKTRKLLMELFMAEHNGRVMYVDLRDVLSDPLGEDRVNFREDGAHAKTIIAVFGQPGFAKAVTDALTDALAKAKELARGVVVAGGCNGGFHRSDTWGRALVDNLNSIMGPTGRVANAQQFALQTSKFREVKHILNTAVSWADAPWTIIDASNPSYGEVEVKARSAATNTYLRIKSHVWWMSTNEAEQAALTEVVKAVLQERGRG